MNVGMFRALANREHGAGRFKGHVPRRHISWGERAMRYLQRLLIAAAALALGACATATVVPVGNTRAPIDPSQVRLYAQPPAHYEVLGILQGNSGMEGTGQSGVNDTINKLKDQAAKL